jgi:hypothetical protein
MAGSSTKPSSSTPRQHKPDLSCGRSCGGGLGTLPAAGHDCFIVVALGQPLVRFQGICHSCWKKLSTSSIIVPPCKGEDDPALPLLVAVASSTKVFDSFNLKLCLRLQMVAPLLSSLEAELGG